MMVQVLDEATADLADEFRFYERQAAGLGDYFLDSLWSDIQSLRLYGGIHAIDKTNEVVGTREFNSHSSGRRKRHR